MLKLKVTSCLMLSALTMSLIFPAKVYACACCADAGTREERTDKLNSYDVQIINSLKFATSAKIRQTPRGENVGVTSNSTNYNLTITKSQGRWNLNFKDAKGKTGTLTFTLPANGVYFKNDSRESRQGQPVILYKEIRLEGKVSGNGIFAKGITPDTKLRLVLQGKGNNCNSAEDFKTWNLQVLGSRANYSFYGNFK
ncbi:MAG TPA: hypothetical protein VK203_06650 [Nostocaceae cyanobacterium]|nr:hypothetical protein [Nostocaceae cyanobacterium]